MTTKKAPGGIRHDEIRETDSHSHSHSHIHLPLRRSVPSSRSSSFSESSNSGMIQTPITVIHENASSLFEHRGQMGYLKTYEEDILRLALSSISLTPSDPPVLSASIKESTDNMDKLEIVDKKHKPFVTTIPEIMLGIFKYLNPIDAVCFSLINKYSRNIYTSHGAHQLLDFQPPLQIGRPESRFPVIPGPEHSCHHCCPVAFFPAHCELHFHLRSFIPSDLTFCAGQCQMFTQCESFDSESCGACGRSYKKQFERGRRMIDVMRPEGRVNKWFEQPRLDRENRQRENRRRLRRLLQQATSSSNSASNQTDNPQL
ncbi:hypothetical protein sscle_16g110860 [Sclerotinia sclerotiorum 1980 UF-70]|uniref:F-box domain-containing protein n=1 Tax=Sclerotinia sclerotiorum (strain ATCC 18683 / 1980 / Ss-1) TaxID=665079 RepID=A0A1D9QN08_SCLS1|nr:hypothetical protein sscle_16g110860 [Sclerotinia sclerotiorum 1980 UF-70]